MRLHHFYWLLLLVCALPHAALAQSVTPNATEMSRLSFLVGQWRGEGWILMGRNERRTFRQSETVQSKVDGTVLVIDGLGKGVKTGDLAESVIHNAFAVISYDKDAKKFRWQAFRGDGTSFDVVPVIADKTIVWGFTDARAGEIRFTIKLNEKGQWVELGEMSRDAGKTWVQFFEMELDKLPS